MEAAIRGGHGKEESGTAQTGCFASTIAASERRCFCTPTGTALGELMTGRKPYLWASDREENSTCGYEFSGPPWLTEPNCGP